MCRFPKSLLALILLISLNGISGQFEILQAPGGITTVGGSGGGVFSPVEYASGVKILRGWMGGTAVDTLYVEWQTGETAVLGATRASYTTSFNAEIIMAAGEKISGSIYACNDDVWPYVSCIQFTTTQSKTFNLCDSFVAGCVYFSASASPFLLTGFFGRGGAALDQLGFYGRVDCPAGSYLLSTVCTSCPGGKFSNVTKSTSCYSCPAGKFAVSGSTICTDCGYGYASSFESASCTSCTGGKFANLTTSTTCSSCPAGTYSLPVASTCTLCGFGYWSNFESKSETDCRSCQLGYFRSNYSETCSICETGKYRGVYTNAYECDVCPAGTYASKAGLTTVNDCTRCLRGKWSAVNGSVSPSVCQDCPLGRYGDTLGLSSMQSCTICEAGKYAVSSGASSCVSCPVGKYQNSSGMTICEDCPLGTLNTEVGADSLARCAPCGKGKYGNPSRVSCDSCPSGRHGGNKEGLKSENECEPCPVGDGLDCPASSPVPRVLKGYYRTMESFDVVRECIPKEACLEGGYNATSCAPGYQGDQCSSCVPYKYYRKDRDCLKCSAQIGKWFLLGIFTILGMYLALKISTPSAEFTSRLRLSLFGLQILAIFPRLTDGWSPQMLRFLGILSITNLNIQFFSYECDVQVDYWGMWVFKLMLPFIIGAVLALLYFVNVRILPKIRKQMFNIPEMKSLKHRYIYSFVLVSNVLYLYMIVNVVEPFQCLKQPDGSYTLMASPGIQCFTPVWRKFVSSVGLIFGILYFIVVPIVVGVIFMKNRKRVMGDKFQAMYGGLTRPFSPQFYYYELVVVVKKISIVVLPDLLSSWLSADVRVLVCFISMFFFFVVDCFCLPYRNQLFNRQNLIWSAVIMFVLLTGLVTSRDGSTTSGEKAAYTVISILLVVVALIYNISTFVSHNVNTIRSSRRVKSKDEISVTANPIMKLGI